MKIKTRNYLITFLMLISLGILLLSGVLTGFTLYQKTFIFPENTYFTGFQDFFVTKFNYIAVICGIFVSLIYIYVSLTYINVEFEKTQSTEIIYFSTFLFGFMFEVLRLLFPICSLWNSSTRFSIMLTRCIIFGRTLAPLSMIFTIIYSNFESRQYVEQNIFLLAAASIFIAMILPLNTSVVNPTGIINYGLGNVIRILEYTLMATAAIAIVIKSIQNNLPARLAAGYILVICGYGFLIGGASILTVAAGTVVLFTGSFIYLKTLHKQYLWN